VVIALAKALPTAVATVVAEVLLTAVATVSRVA